MKLKNKFYLIHFLITLTLIIFIWIMYHTFQQQNQDNLDHEVTKSIHINKLLLNTAIDDNYAIFKQETNLFTRIHHTALNEFKKDQNTSLMLLRNKMIRMFELKDVKFDLYVIDKNYVKTS